MLVFFCDFCFFVVSRLCLQFVVVFCELLLCFYICILFVVFFCLLLGFFISAVGFCDLLNLPTHFYFCCFFPVCRCDFWVVVFCLLLCFFLFVIVSRELLHYLFYCYCVFFICIWVLWVAVFYLLLHIYFCHCFSSLLFPVISNLLLWFAPQGHRRSWHNLMLNPVDVHLQCKK